jgi:SsrA-binding protein
MATDKKNKDKKIEVVNRKASHEYEFIKEYQAGIQLTGTEIKTIKAGNVNLNDCYCLFEGNELFAVNMYIAEYEFGNIHNHLTRRKRKLLLRRQELNQLEKRVKEKGLTIVPYRLFVNEKGFAKLVVELASGKKAYDKRESIKDRESKRELDRLKKIKL